MPGVGSPASRLVQDGTRRDKTPEDGRALRSGRVGSSPRAFGFSLLLSHRQSEERLRTVPSSLGVGGRRSAVWLERSTTLPISCLFSRHRFVFLPTALSHFISCIFVQMLDILLIYHILPIN